MKEFKGTPGPWVYDEFRRAIGVVSKDDDQSFGMVCGEVAWIEFIGKGVETHNANLIAAAPAMLNFIMELMDEEGENLEEKGHWSFYAMKELIKKALGE